MARWKRRLWLACLAFVVVVISVYVAIQFANPSLPVG